MPLLTKISFNERYRINDFLDNLELTKKQGHEEHKEIGSIKSAERIEQAMASGLNCLTCKCNFDVREVQISHYRSDWHRYNLKQRLLGEPVAGEDQFELIADSLSISGSDTDTDTDEEDDDYYNDIEYLSISVLKEDKIEGVKFQDDRQPKFYFKNENDDVISIYKKVLFNNQADVMHTDITRAVTQVLGTAQTCFWFVILLNAGHFAAAVFEGSSVLAHKTFHRYIVRAKRGTVQSINDSNRKGNTAKSAGASIRRHNEAALEESIKTLVNSWKEIYYENCSRVFLRLPQYRKALFYGGKDPLFNPKDPRIRSIPFATRRPTHNEVLRVHKELFSITLHGKLEEFEAASYTKSQTLKEYEADQTNVISSSTLPEVEIEKTENVAVNELESEEPSQPNNKRKKQKKKQKKKSPIANPEVSKSSEVPRDRSPPHHEDILARLYTACKVSDVESAERILASDLTPVDSESRNPTDKASGNYKRDILNHPLDKSGDTLLHVASRRADKLIIDLLLEHGSDPTIRNASHLPPYCVCSTKDAKNVYKQFRTRNPELHDYHMAQMPPPLSDEQEAENKKRQAEKKKALRAAKKEREKLKKEEEIKRLEEQTEKERFLALSDREKRLVAIERRFVGQAHHQESQAKRCFTCAESLFAKVPFEYFNYQFCSVNCLKIHKSKSKS